MGKELPKPEFYKHLDTEVKEYEANKEIHNMEEVPSKTDHPHDFKLVSGNRAECQCGWGIYLFADDEINEGKLFNKGTLII